MKLLLAVLLLLLLAIPSATQDTTFTYTGNQFNLWDGSYKSQTEFNPNYSITGSFTTNLDLFQLSNLNDYAIPTADILTFSFTDNGGLSLNPFNSTSELFEISTDQNGKITSPQGWDILIEGAAGELSTSSCLEGSCRGAQDWSVTNTGYGQTASGDAGTWTSHDPAPVPTPEPGTFMLLAMGLGLALGAARKKVRA